MHLGVIGLGAIGQALIAALDGRDGCFGVTRLSLLARSESRATAQAHLTAGGPLARDAHVYTNATDLAAARPDLVVECAGHAAVTAHLPVLLGAGIDVVLASVGSLADKGCETLLRRAAEEGGARLILPSGAIGGIDLVSALALSGQPMQLQYRGIKPPAAWAGSPAEARLDLGKVTEPAVHFTGTAREAATAYPKNANVAATLALAGPGLDHVTVELIADPDAAGNIHDYTVTTDAARIAMRIEGRPSAGNARTSASTMLSLLREIRNRTGHVVI